MIKTLYNKYFQKSRSFLYPLLGIPKKNNPGPIQTYLGWEEITPNDKKLICLFANDLSPSFVKFQEKKLIANPLYESHTIVDSHIVYVFNYTPYEKDWNLFLKGKYSQLSDTLKGAVKDYYGSDTSEYQFIESYLFPEKYFEVYSKLLDIDIKTIKKVGELCDKYDCEKEVLVFSTKHLEISNN